MLNLRETRVGEQKHLPLQTHLRNAQDDRNSLFQRWPLKRFSKTMPETHAMANAARTRRPRKKISMARSMVLVYDAEHNKGHGKKCCYQHIPRESKRQSRNQALRTIKRNLQHESDDNGDSQNPDEARREILRGHKYGHESGATGHDRPRGNNVGDHRCHPSMVGRG